MIVATHVALRGHVINASPSTALGNNTNNGVRQMTDSCINIVLPSRISIILFYFILLQLSERCNKTTETTVDGQFSVIFCYFIANGQAALERIVYCRGVRPSVRPRRACIMIILTLKHVHLFSAVFFQFYLEKMWGMDAQTIDVISQERLKLEVTIEC